MTDKEKQLMQDILEIAMNVRHIYGLFGTAEKLENLVKNYEKNDKPCRGGVAEVMEILDEELNR